MIMAVGNIEQKNGNSCLLKDYGSYIALSCDMIVAYSYYSTYP